MDKKNEASKCYERAENGKDKEGKYIIKNNIYIYRNSFALISKIIWFNGIWIKGS